MAKVDPNSILTSIHGKLSRHEQLTLAHRNGQTYAYQATDYPDPATPLQLSHRQRFRRATALALADMTDPVRLRHWQQVADESEGRYRTPRGAAFAHYYTSIKLSFY